MLGIGSGETIQDRLSREKVTTGFEYLRLGLALAILCVHSVAVSGSMPFRVELDFTRDAA